MSWIWWRSPPKFPNAPVTIYSVYSVCSQTVPKLDQRANARTKRAVCSGGQARSTIFRKLDEWHSCQRAVVIQIAPESGKVRTGVEYVSPPQVLADDSA